jgi:hypothetical protein
MQRNLLTEIVGRKGRKRNKPLSPDCYSQMNHYLLSQVEITIQERFAGFAGSASYASCAC